MGILVSPVIDDLIVNIRTALNAPNPQNSFWTDEEITDYCNKAVTRYFVEVCQSEEGLFAAQADLDIVSGQDVVPLPTDFFKLIGVLKLVTEGYEMLNYRNNLTQGYTTDDDNDPESYRPYYYLRGNNLVLRDPPNFSQTAGLRIEYIQFPATMITGGDTMTAQVSPIFKDLIESYAVYRARIRESSVNGTNTYGPAKEVLSDLFIAFKEIIAQRALNPIYILPFNPEEC